MEDFFLRWPPPPWHPKADPIKQAYLERMASMDIAFRQKIREMNRRLPLFVLLKMQGGSGMRMANILRHFFIEYTERLTTYGPYSFPTSFNVVEAFLSFNEDLMIFDLRQEREHLLRLHDYFDWYTAEQAIPDDPKILVDIMQEGESYSFDVAGDTGDYVISAEGSHIAIGGLSMVRHANELSTILLAAEAPPYPPDSEAQEKYSNMHPVDSRKGIVPNPDLSVRDRYFEGMKGFSKVIVLTRFDLDSRNHDVRYIHIDVGPGYLIFTDDIDTLLVDVPKEERDGYIKNSLNGLKRYSQIYSALASLIYLPVMFVAEASRVVETEFVTKLKISRQKYYVKKAAKEFGEKSLQLNRIVRCLTNDNTDNLVMTGRQIIEPPPFKLKSTGFWKPIGANEIGEDRHGNNIVGKTWVERTDIYAAKSPESFAMKNSPKFPFGNDPGVIYIMRSPAHSNDLYKVGFTRRPANERATEIGSSTGVPLPFEVLASWVVSDCAAIEKNVHNQLKGYRVSKRREFFRTSLSTIIAAVELSIKIYDDSLNEEDP